MTASGIGWMVAGATILIAGAAFGRWLQAKREAHIRRYVFSRSLLGKLKAKRPSLEPKDLQLVARALRQFFLVYLNSGRRRVAMPSQVVDDLWHEFILDTRQYSRFCDDAFGRFLHHTPAVVLSAERKSNEGLRRVWWYACLEENIDPRAATRLPLLFAIDRKLGIGDGFDYELDCRGRPSQDGKVTHCGGDMSSTSFDGTIDGFGSDSSSGDGGSGGSDGGCSGGCGGD